MARYPLPGYITSQESRRKLISSSPSGHRFLLYFRSWNIRDNEKRESLSEVCSQTEIEPRILIAIMKRQFKAARTAGAYMLSGKLTSPFVTGMGNPHPVENGFSFLTPYGIPYLPGSSIKGVVRRAAEELALMDDDSGWTIPKVWALFGFEAGSAYLTGKCEHLSEGWQDIFVKWVKDKADNDNLLRAWLDIICPDKNRKEDEPERSPSEILLSWIEEKGENARKEIHYKGILRFWDAFPSGDVKLDVDIMNPHHRGYYEGKNSPHDSEQPVPIFFLVMKPGAQFNFFIEAENRLGLLDLVGDWKSLISEAFNYAFDWLGFGAKTSVGYGAFKRDTEAELRIEEERRAKLARREADAKKHQEEEEKRRLEKELASMPVIDRLIRRIEMVAPDDTGQQFVNTECLPKLDELEGEDRKRLAAAIMGFYQRIGKWEGKLSEKQKKKVQKIKEILELYFNELNQ